MNGTTKLIKKELFTTDVERDALLANNSGLRLLEHHSNGPTPDSGGYLVFTDEPDKIKEIPPEHNDTLLQNLKSKTPQQAADWVQTNVTDLASAKTVLKAYAKAISYLLRNMDD